MVYAWYSSDKADGEFALIEGQTGSSLTATDAMAGKYIKVQVTGDAESVASAVTTEAVKASEDAELAITAKQIGASKIEISANKAIAATDSVTVKRGSANVDATFVPSADGLTVTITTGTKIANADYEVTVTPADKTKAAAKATFTGKAAALTKIDFVGENLILRSSEYTSCSVKIYGYNDFDEQVALSSLQPYSSKGTATYSAADNEITLTLGGGTQLFTTGETITVTAVYQDGSNVQQVAKALTVSAMASVAEMTFGELQTSNTTLQKAERVDITGMSSGTYYKTVVAKDQYNNTLTAKELTNMVYNATTRPSGTLFVTPSQSAGAYVYLTDFDTDSKNNVIAKYNIGDLKMPGTQTFNFTAVGGYSATDTITIEDDPYIAELSVSVPDVYGGKDAELSVTGIDQYGAAVDMYDFVGTTNDGSGATTIDATAAAGTYYFDDYNHTTKAGSTITVPKDLKLKVTKNTTTKTVKFILTAPDNDGTSNVPYSLVVQSAKPAVANVQVSVQPNPYAYGISQTLKSGGSTIVLRSGSSADLVKNVLILDNYGASFDYADKIFGVKDNHTLETATKVTSSTAGDATADWVYQVLDSTNTIVSAPAAISTAGKYSAELWYDKGGTADHKYTQLSSKSFEIKVASTDYKSYSASLKSSDKLLYTGNDTAAAGDPTDHEVIVVKGTDANGNTVELTDGIEYDVALRTTSVGSAGTITENASVVTCNSAEALGATPETGTIVADIYVGSQVVTSVDIPYSNAAPVTSGYSAKKSDKDYDLSGGIEVKSTTLGTYLYCNDATYKTATVYVFPEGANGVVYADEETAAKAATYKIALTDQYGMSRIDAKFAGSGTAWTDGLTTALFAKQGTLTLSDGKYSVQTQVTTADGSDAAASKLQAIEVTGTTASTKEIQITLYNPSESGVIVLNDGADMDGDVTFTGTPTASVGTVALANDVNSTGGGTANQAIIWTAPANYTKQNVVITATLDGTNTPGGTYPVFGQGGTTATTGSFAKVKNGAALATATVASATIADNSETLAIAAGPNNNKTSNAMFSYADQYGCTIAAGAALADTDLTWTQPASTTDITLSAAIGTDGKVTLTPTKGSGSGTTDNMASSATFTYYGVNYKFTITGTLTNTDAIPGSYTIGLAVNE